MTTPPPAPATAAARLIIILHSRDAALIEQALALPARVDFPLELHLAAPAELLPHPLPAPVRLLPPAPEQGGGEQFFAHLLGEGIAPPPQADDLILRLAPAAPGRLSRVEAYIVGALQRALLNVEHLAAMRRALPAEPRLGLASPAGAARQRVEDSLVSIARTRLADALGIPAAAFQDARYHPYGLYFLSGAATLALRAAHARAPQPALFRQALEAGLGAFLAHAGLAVVTSSPIRPAARPRDQQDYLAQMLATPLAESRHPEFSPPEPLPPAAAGELKYIAYYLPQFHPIPENDAWWGRGFTEWSNVSKAVPRFAGHHQPQLPADLGFYDLRRVEVMGEQIELARSHGIHGFCFYFYWFNGRTLLETPLQQLRQHPELDFPFCLCWANENWTRRWDGQEQDVLMEQAHSPRDDLAFIRHVEAYLRDPRYIRIDGKPVLLVYRASLLDDPRATAQRWREHAARSGLGGLYLVAVGSFEVGDPRPLGFDAAVEFPPHQLASMPPINAELPLVDPTFSGEILDYRQNVLLAALGKLGDDAVPPYPVLRGVMSAWDNEARRPGRGRIYHHATPAAYAIWLELASRWTRRHNPPGHQYVFINAWNEWAEGAHLEPDRHFGHAWLAATADVAARHAPGPAPRRTGSLRAARRLLPAGLARALFDTDPEHYRRRLQQLGHTPALRVVIHAAAVDYPLLQTLHSLAEQQGAPVAVSVLAPEACPASWLPPHFPPLHSVPTTTPGEALRQLAAGHGEDYLVLLHAGDRLFPNTLLALQERLASHPGIQLLDADELRQQGSEVRLELFPATDRERLRCAAPAAGLLALARPLVAAAGLRLEDGAAGEHELRLCCLETHGAAALRHLPEVLVWRAASAACGAEAQAARLAAQADNTRRHLQRCAIAAEVSTNEQGNALVVRYLPQSLPRVSVIIPTRDQQAALQRCIEGLLGGTDYPDLEILLVKHAGDDAASQAFARGLPALAPGRIHCLEADGPFNFAALCNLGARHASGDLLLFLNDDTAALHPDWLQELCAQALQPDTAIAGARLLFPDGRIQHAGLTVGLNGSMDFPWSGASLQEGGWQGELHYAREVSAVSAACLLVRRGPFGELGGFDEALDLGYADADLCLRARSRGWRVVWTPHATLLHEGALSLKTLASAEAGDATRRFAAAQALFCQRWKAALLQDPWHHPALALNARHYRLESTPELQPWALPWHPLPRVYGLPADAAGSGHYRVAQPLAQADAAALVQGRVAGGYPLPRVLERLGVDVLHTQRQVDDAQLEALARLRAETGIRVVMDFDDLLTRVPAGSFHQRQVWPDIARRVEAACALADLVTVSTSALAEHMGALHPAIRVIPNGIDPARWAPLAEAPRHRPRGTRLRVGWAGGISHAPDLAVIREVVAQLADEVDWVFLGMCLDELRPHLAEFHRGVPMERYPEALAALDLDLAIAPLASNPFNECKSNLRLLEYGALGLPVIATDILPYQCGLPVTLLRNTPRAWIDAIRARIGEPQALREEGASLRQAVLQDWNIARQLPAWVQAWRGN